MRPTRLAAIGVLLAGIAAAVVFALAEPLDTRCYSEGGNQIACYSRAVIDRADDNGLAAGIAFGVGVVGAIVLWLVPSREQRQERRERDRERREAARANFAKDRAERADAAAKDRAAGLATAADPANDQLATWGWITAIFFPIIGAIIGIVLMTKADQRGGPILGASLVVAVIFYVWFAADLASDLST